MTERSAWVDTIPVSVALHRFEDRCKSADIGKQSGHIPALPAKILQTGVGCDPVGHRRGKILTKGILYFPALPLLDGKVARNTRAVKPVEMSL